MPAELTTCSPDARAAAREDASLGVLEPKTPTCLLPMAAAAHVNALLQVFDGVFLAGLPLALSLPSRVRHLNGLLPRSSRPLPSRSEVRPDVLRDRCVACMA